MTHPLKEAADEDSLIHLMTDEELYAHAQSVLEILRRHDKKKEE